MSKLSATVGHGICAFAQGVVFGGNVAMGLFAGFTYAGAVVSGLALTLAAIHLIAVYTIVKEVVDKLPKEA